MFDATKNRNTETGPSFGKSEHSDVASEVQDSTEGVHERKGVFGYEEKIQNKQRQIQKEDHSSHADIPVAVALPSEDVMQNLPDSAQPHDAVHNADKLDPYATLQKLIEG